MNNTDDPADPDKVARLADAIFRTFAQAGATHGDAFQALIQVQLTAIVEVAKDEDERRMKMKPWSTSPGLRKNCGRTSGVTGIAIRLGNL